MNKNTRNVCLRFGSLEVIVFRLLRIQMNRMMRWVETFKSRGNFVDKKPTINMCWQEPTMTKDDFKIPHTIDGVKYVRVSTQGSSKRQQRRTKNEAWNVINPILLHHEMCSKYNNRKSICYHQPSLTEQQWTNARRTQIGSKWRLNETTKNCFQSFLRCKCSLTR